MAGSDANEQKTTVKKGAKDPRLTRKEEYNESFEANDED